MKSELAHPTRRAILEMLREGERTAGHLASSCGGTRPVVAHHLSVLIFQGLVRCRAEGTLRYYARVD
jgi:DNA-binding transcriptional ArsR family regulator